MSTKEVSDMQVAINKLAKRALQEDKQKKLETIIKIQAGVFDKAAAYTNMVVMLGYAVFFTVWANSKAYIPDNWFVLSALLVSFSVLLFVAFEIYRMFTLRETFKGLQILAATPDELFHGQYAKQEKLDSQMNIRTMKAWTVVFPLTLLSGIAGGSILLVGFARFLLLQW